MPNISWRVKLLGLFTIVLGASLLFQLFYVIPSVNQNQIEIIERQQEIIALDIEREVSSAHARMVNILNNLAGRAEFREMNISIQQQTISQVVDYSSEVTSIFVMDSEGWFVAGTVDDLYAFQTRSYENDPFFSVPFEQGQVYFNAPRSYPDNTIVFTAITVPIESDTGETVALLMGSMSLNGVIENVTNYPVDESTTISLIDTEGTLIARSDTNLFALEEGPLSLSLNDNPIFQNIERTDTHYSTEGDTHFRAEYEIDGVSYFGIYHSIDPSSWGIAVEIPMDVIFNTAKKLGGNLLRVNIGLFAISLVVALWFSNQITSERKQAEEKERQLQQELNLSSRLASVGEMAAGIAHEINNPLTGVVGFSDLLMKKDIPEDIRKDVEIIYDGAQRVAAITSRMLAYARQSKPKQIMADINDIIKATLDMRTYEMESSNIKVSPQLDPDLPVTMADAGQLQQVFLNIILNAETEMINAHGKGNLSVKTERIDNAIRVSFKDDGPGISKENLNRIFNPFFTTREVGKGAGLGLSVSHGIVHQHSGKIYAKSTLGKGATFIVEIPIVTKEEQLKMAEPAIQLGKVAKARILVVDDDTIVQKFLTEILREEGHEVEIIDNGNDALKKLESENYDLILLDIKLPGMSGIDLYKHLQKTAKSITRKVLFITGDTMSTDTMSFISTAKPAYITKPFDTDQLKREMSHILSQRK